ncbi:hypothetical protein [Okeania sp. SIO1I7]|nr:hypothetical protein [Okeania sp. SIO1I7]
MIYCRIVRIRARYSATGKLEVRSQKSKVISDARLVNPDNSEL